jgi:hypothetical protein
MPVIPIRRVQAFAHVAALLFGFCALAAGIAVIASRWS